MFYTNIYIKTYTKLFSVIIYDKISEMRHLVMSFCLDCAEDTYKRVVVWVVFTVDSERQGYKSVVDKYVIYSD